jgi:hypothetical protein
MAAKFRINGKCDPGFQSKIQGHPWYKYIDSALESKEIEEVIEYLRPLYLKPCEKQPPQPTVQVSSAV